MSSLAVNAITDASGGSAASINGYTPSASNMTGRNRIINGAMMIDQRNAGASVTPTSSQYLVDRWEAVVTQASKISAQQNAGSVTPPAAFSNYQGITSLSAYSVLTGDAFALRQYIEGFNVSDLGWGTASAQAITVSFMVRSSLTGNFGGNIANGAFNRSYPFSYTINAANTWEKKSITIPGDTSGTWLTNNNIGMALTFGLGYGASLSGTANAWNAGTAFMPTGSVSVVGTSGATWYITGVQLEVGSTASEFEHRLYGQELQLAQRYFQIVANSAGSNGPGLGTKQGSNYICWHIYYNQMRATPTWDNAPTSWTIGTITGTQAGSYNFVTSAMVTMTGTFSVLNQLGNNQGRLYFATTGSFNGSAGDSMGPGVGSAIRLSAEL